MHELSLVGADGNRLAASVAGNIDQPTILARRDMLGATL
jgi:hypothetical protein